MPANPAIRQLGRTTAARLARNLRPTPQRREQGRPLAVHLAVQASAALPALRVSRIDSEAAANFRGRELGSRRAPESRPRGVSRRRRTCRACGEPGGFLVAREGGEVALVGCRGHPAALHAQGVDGFDVCGAEVRQAEGGEEALCSESMVGSQVSGGKAGSRPWM